MTEEEVIYVELLGEGTAVWRPVSARKVGSDTYRIVEEAPDPELEVWQFVPGDVADCELRKLAGGENLVAVRLHRTA